MFILTVIQFSVLLSAWHPKAKKLIAQAKKENIILDFTADNTRQSIIILNTGSIIISTKLPKDIIENIEIRRL